MTTRYEVPRIGGSLLVAPAPAGMVRVVASRAISGEVVDMVAVGRFVLGETVALAPGLERRVAIHEARSAGASIDSIAKRLHVHDRKVKAELARPWPTDSLNRPIRLPGAVNGHV